MSDQRILTAEERQGLRAEIAKAARERTSKVECPGCGDLIPETRRYCSKACANRHWHVRKREQEDT